MQMDFSLKFSFGVKFSNKKESCKIFWKNEKIESLCKKQEREKLYLIFLMNIISD